MHPTQGRSALGSGGSSLPFVFQIGPSNSINTAWPNMHDKHNGRVFYIEGLVTAGFMLAGRFDVWRNSDCLRMRKNF